LNSSGYLGSSWSTEQGVGARPRYFGGFKLSLENVVKKFFFWPQILRGDGGEAIKGI
jgi:hypothetical protein